MCRVLRGELEGLLNQTVRSLRGRAESERDAALIMVELVQGRAAERVSATGATRKTICLDAQRARDPGQKNYKGGK